MPCTTDAPSERGYRDHSDLCRLTLSNLLRAVSCAMQVLARCWCWCSGARLFDSHFCCVLPPVPAGLCPVLVLWCSGAGLFDSHLCCVLPPVPAGPRQVLVLWCSGAGLFDSHLGCVLPAVPAGPCPVLVL